VPTRAWIAILGLGCASALAAQHPFLYPARAFAAPGPAVCFADLDGDGRTDAVGNGSDSVVRWSRGLPSAQFASPLPLGPTQVGSCVAAVDADADTDIDLYLYAYPGPLQLWRNDGSANFTFDSSVSSPGGFFFDIQVVDLNSDQRPELVATDWRFPVSSLLLYVARASGGYAAPVVLATIGIAETARALELDGQGGVDLVIASTGLPVRALLNDGTASFTAPLTTNLLLENYHWIAADMNLDGRGDLINGDMWFGSTPPWIAYGGHPAGFHAPVPLPSTGQGGLLQVLDWNGDLWPDLALGGEEWIRVLLGGAGGAFVPQTPIQVSASKLAFDDLDADGARELLGFSMSSGTASTVPLLNVVQGSAGPDYAPYEQPGPIGTSPHTGIETADLDTDGNADLVYVRLGPVAGLDVRLGQGGGLFTALPPGAPTSLNDFTLADATGDGRADVVGMRTSGGRLTCFAGAGDGTFGAPITTLVGTPNPETLECADYDGDGRVDALLGSGPAKLAHGLGNGSFASPQELPGALIGARPARALDLNEDGFPDPVMHVSPSSPTASMQWWLSNGAGGYASPSQLPSAGAVFGSAIRVVSGDFDGDGHADLAHTSSTTTLELLYGNGLGGLTHAKSVALAQAALPVLAADLDLDGRDDLVCGAESGSTSTGYVTLVLGADAAAPVVVDRYIGKLSTDAVVLDVDHDGRLELATEFGVLLRNELAAEVGLASYGSGTAGCQGTQALTGSVAPKVGASDFALVCHGAPPQSIGLGLIGSVSNAGSDPLGIGLVLHVGLGGQLVPFHASSSASGSCTRSAPIPNDAQLVGVQLFAQLIWQWSPSASCDPSLLGLSSTRGLALTIQP
jgi:hypothetical protein